MAKNKSNETIEISGKTIGCENPCFIIAEAGVNHNGSVALAKKLIDAAKDAGVDAVKFQTYRTEDIVNKSAEQAEYQKKNTGKVESQFDMLKRLELSYDSFRELKKYCDKKKIIFMTTAHTESALDFVDEIVPAFKVGSGDLNNYPFLERIAKKGKPMIISTGMSKLEEIVEAVRVITKYNKDLVVLHCTTQYPTPKEYANLKAMETLRKELGCLIGYSDHTEGIEIPLYAASLGAVVIEKHFTLDRNMEGPDHKASLEPKELKDMVEKIRMNFRYDIPKEYLGTGIKKPTKEEIEVAKIARKSIVAREYIPKGTIITSEYITIKRPGDGIDPKFYDDVIGKKTKKDIAADSLLKWSDIR